MAMECKHLFDFPWLNSQKAGSRMESNPFSLTNWTETETTVLEKDSIQRSCGSIWDFCSRNPSYLSSLRYKRTEERFLGTQKGLDRCQPEKLPKDAKQHGRMRGKDKPCKARLDREHVLSFEVSCSSCFKAAHNGLLSFKVILFWFSIKSYE